MELGTFQKLEKVVPNIPDQLLDICTKASVQIRDQLVMKHRAAILILTIKNQICPINLIPPGDDITIATPQQLQFISVLVDFIHQNPHLLVKALRARFQKPNKAEFNFLCSSAIPAFYGFFSSSEHVALSFPYFCSLVGVASPDLTVPALVPFYSCACTYKFIEFIYDRFGTKFCHDLRITGKDPSKALPEYAGILIQAIKDAFLLLPQPHQFLLKYMRTRGWPQSAVANFLLHQFLFPQLAKFMRSTPFKTKLHQLSFLARLLDGNGNFARELYDVFDEHSIIEIPNAFTVFDIPYTQMLMTPADVDSVVQALISVGELPTSMNAFINGCYFTEISWRPFWVRVYSRKPRPVKFSVNWRPVVFDDDYLSEAASKSGTNFSEEEEETSSAAMERNWLKVEAEAEAFGKHPYHLLTEEPKTPEEKIFVQTVYNILGDSIEQFKAFALRKSLEELGERAATFEKYLVYRLSHANLAGWNEIVDDTLQIMVIPFAEESMAAVLKDIPARSLFRNPRLIDQLLDQAAATIDMPAIRQMQCMMLLQHMLPAIVGPRTSARMRYLEGRWSSHVERIRTTLKLPPAFSNRSPNRKQAALLNQRLWEVTAHLAAAATVPFAALFRVFNEAMEQLAALSEADGSEDALTQYALAFCESPAVFTRFILVNSLFVKQERFRSMSDNDSDLARWCRLETSILKMLSLDPELMADALGFQTSLIESGVV